jgi:hypothetical protein
MLNSILHGVLAFGPHISPWADMPWILACIILYTKYISLPVPAQSTSSQAIEVFSQLQFLGFQSYTQNMKMEKYKKHAGNKVISIGKTNAFSVDF